MGGKGKGKGGDPKDQIKALFNQCDVDGSGSVSLQELKDVFTKLRPGWTDEEFKELFNSADEDGDGGLDVDEFIEWVFEEGASRPPPAVKGGFKGKGGGKGGGPPGGGPPGEGKGDGKGKGK
eukprot:gnl/MRDRNA2_/MRDRNA2_97233_c0_seq1.p2 gnl/MRDRNA2_/MRDRNA2_97233_c0~~gnl/MRDRNA2_/MRDRNA2_97233_c0_seq1.p2  ORF type:complete len:122 (+),score=37.84 gnl/MRDRNA2_/MRDRNA2_97233_c0_seq1:91-456(+)